MKYKAKFEILTHKVLSEPVKMGEIYNAEKEGVFVFIPFTDTNFFEPVKTRKFEIEVSEDEMSNFEYRTNYEEWKVTEITEPTKVWIDRYRNSGSYNTDAFTNEQLELINIDNFNLAYRMFYKLQGVKWIKDQFGKGLRESKELADFIYSL